jgi:hypothetical protein
MGRPSSSSAVGLALALMSLMTSGSCSREPARPRGVCELVTKDEAAAVLGRPVKDGVRKAASGKLGRELCTYESVDSKLVKVMVLTYAQDPSEVDDLVQGAVEAWETQAEPVTGVGDRAAMVGRQLIVVTGKTIFSLIDVSGGDPAQARQATIDLAQKVLKRLS